jgi:predicted permease
MWTRLRQGLRFFQRGDRMHDEIHREIASHLQMEIDHRIAAGASPAEARRATLIDFGAVGAIEEEVQDVRGLTFWDHLTQDLRYGWRTLRRSPGYTFAAVLTLGLGIGLNTAMFSVINGTLLHPLPYRDSGRLIRIRLDAPLANRPNLGVSVAETRDLRDRLTGLESFVEYHSMHFVLLNQGEPHRVNTAVVSSQYFDVFGIKPLHGRTFTETDDAMGAEPVLILSHAFWQTEFGGDPNVVGKTVRMNDHNHTIVGVLPAIPRYPNDDDVYMPTSACPFRAAAEKPSQTNHRAFSILNVFGRMKPGETLASINAQAQGAGRAWVVENAAQYQLLSGFTASAVSLDEEITHEARPILFTLIGVTALVLLIACANVANLSLSRMLGRGRELALRSALGASRGRLTRQLVTESLIVAFAGAVLALAIALPAARLLAGFASRFTPRAIDPSIDGVVLGFTLVTALVTGLVFGTAPALSARRAMMTSLKDGAPQGGEGPRRQRMRSALVVAQVTVCFALVVAAGLFLESLHRLSTVDLGYKDDEHVLTAQLHGNFSHQQTPQEFVQFHNAVIDGLKKTPGVNSVAVTNALPMTGSPGPLPLSVRGQVMSEPAPTVDGNIITSEYFGVLGVPLLHGRTFAASDNADAPRVAIINQSMAKLWDKRDPIGHEFSVPVGNGGAPTTFQVVGVVGDIKQYAVDQQTLAQFFVPMEQTPGFGAQVMLRTTRDPLTLAGALKTIVHGLDNQIPVEDIQTLRELRMTQLQSPALATGLLLMFAALALVITLAGIGAVIATSVSQRTREFGVRMALGASRNAVLSLVLGQAARLLVIGLVLGAGGALVFSRVIAQYLFNTPPNEPDIYIAVAAIVLVAGTIACLAPARRATKVDPLIALRAE